MRLGQRRVRRRMYLAERAQCLLVERTQPKSADVARPVVALRDGVIFHGLCADPADLLAIVRERDLGQLASYCHRRIGRGSCSMEGTSTYCSSACGHLLSEVGVRTRTRPAFSQTRQARQPYTTRTRLSLKQDGTTAVFQETQCSIDFR